MSRRTNQGRRPSGRRTSSVGPGLVALLMLFGVGCGNKAGKAPGKRRPAARLSPVSLERWNQVRLVRIDDQPEPGYWLRIPGEWYPTSGMAARAHYRYAGERELKVVTRPGRVTVNGKLVGVDLTGQPTDRARMILDPIRENRLSITLDGKPKDSNLWKAIAGLTARELFFRVVAEPGSGMRDQAVATLAQLRTLGRRVVGLALAGFAIDDTLVGELRGLPELRFLSLAGTRLTSRGLARLVDAAPGLETLLIDAAQPREKGIDDAGLIELSRLSRLQRLRVNGKQLSKKGLSSLRKLKHLRVLSLTVTKLPDRDLKAVGGLTGLTWLHLWFQRPGPAVVTRICRLKSLRVLDIGPDAAASAMQCLGQLTELRSLTLRSQAVTDATLEHVAPLRELTDLSLTRGSINGSGLAHLKPLQGLRRLNLNWLEGPFESANLAHVAALQRLEALDLGRLSLTDADLARLHGLKRLRQLNLYGVKNVTADGAAALKKALGACRVEGP